MKAMTVAAVCAGLTAVVLPAAQQAPARHTHVVIVVDGLRPDYMTADVMPRFFRLGRRGIVFNAHHAVFPTVTRVNGPSFVTGTYPETHGLMGNAIYIPKASPARALSPGGRATLEAAERADSPLLTAPTLGEILQRSGRKVLAVSSGSSGSAFLLNHTTTGGATVHPEFTLPPDLAVRAAARLGPAPPRAAPHAAHNQATVAR